MRIVFAAVGDPVGAGVVQSLARPGGNATGPSLQQTDTVGKRLGLFRELTPVCAVWRSWPIAQMRPPSWRCAMLRRRPALSASSRSHRKVHRREDFVPAFDALRGRVDALYLPRSPTEGQ